MANQDNDQSELIYALQEPKDLPEWCRELFDPDRPIPAEVAYIRRRYDSNMVVVIFLALPAIFAVLMTVIDGYHGKLVLKEWLAMFPILTLPLVITLWCSKRDNRFEEQIKAGKLRLGLFLSASALLLRMSPDDCSIIPRRWISNFDLTMRTTGKASNRHSYDIKLTYRLKTGTGYKEKHINIGCPELDGYFSDEQALLELLKSWLPDGSIPAHIQTQAAQSSQAHVAGSKNSKNRRGPLTPN